MKKFSNIFKQKMERKEFLIYLGVFFISVSGFAGVLKNLSSFDFQKTRQFQPKKLKKEFSGYSRGSYGS